MAKKTAYLFENVWTIPNIISFIRILLIPVFGVLLTSLLLSEKSGAHIVNIIISLVLVCLGIATNK